jgi:archaellum component FlaF (FlaF/FlaG flagellin family)
VLSRCFKISIDLSYLEVKNSNNRAYNNISSTKESKIIIIISSSSSMWQIIFLFLFKEYRLA